MINVSSSSSLLSSSLPSPSSSCFNIRVVMVREKSGKKGRSTRSGKSQGKSLVFSKSVKSPGILFSGLQFISFLPDFEMQFLSEKMKSMLQNNLRDHFDTLCLTHVVVVVSGFRCECFLPNSFFLFPQKVERG